MIENEPVYFDYAATTPLDKEIAEQMLPYMTRCFGNASSIHSFGRDARQAAAAGRAQVAALLGAAPAEIFFTSGGSESDNWALKGIALANRDKGNHIITTAIEHQAVLRSCHWLESQGFQVTYLPVDSKGRIRMAELRAAVTAQTILISVMAANNEIGTIEPLEEIGRFARAQGIFFHTDAVQAAAHIPLDVHAMSVDALSLSAHKFYGPKGIGALYLRPGIPIQPWLHGGAQERGLRAGTENVAGIVGMGLAAERGAERMMSERKHLLALRELLLDGLQDVAGIQMNGDLICRLPGNVNFSIAGIANEALMIRLDMAGFAVSAGSACSAGSLEPSHVLLALGQSPAQASSAIRISLGAENTEGQITRFLEVLHQSVHQIRQSRS